MKTQSLLFTLALLMGAPALALGSTETGNGGDGVYLDGKLYLLDLVEAGVEENPSFRDGVRTSEVARKRLEESRLGRLKKMDIEPLARKVTELAYVIPLAGEILLAAIEELEWSFVRPELIEVRDEGDSPLSFPRLKKVQLAVRHRKKVTINRQTWSELDSTNQTALILHEAIYALTEGQVRAREGFRASYRQRVNSTKARHLVGVLFGPAWVNPDDSVLDALKGVFPTTGGMIFKSVLIDGVPAFFGTDPVVAFGFEGPSYDGAANSYGLVASEDSKATVRTKIGAVCGKMWTTRARIPYDRRSPLRFRTTLASPYVYTLPDIDASMALWGSRYDAIVWENWTWLPLDSSSENFSQHIYLVSQKSTWMKLCTDEMSAQVLSAQERLQRIIEEANGRRIL